MEMNEQQVKQMMNLWEQGGNVFQISRKMELRSSTIRAQLIKQGVPREQIEINQYVMLRRHIEEIRELVASGYTQRQIAQKYNITEQTVSLFFRDHNIMRPTVYAPLEKNMEELRRLAAEGYSQEEIAERFEMFPQQVNYFCKKNGINTNGRRRPKEQKTCPAIKANGKDHYPCHIPVTTFQVCRTRCYLAYKCPAAQDSAPALPDYTVRGENSRSLWRRRAGSENVHIIERSL